MLQLGKKITLGEPIYKFQNNHSVDFDGVDDFIQLGEPISYTQHTISTWIKVSDSDASKTIIDARDSADDGVRIFLTNHEEVIYSVNTSDITSGSAISVDEWHHIVGTYDGTTQKLYIDGSLVSSATTSQTINTTTNAEIGARNFSDRANEFAGKIDELAIWDRALTAAEVTEIYRIKYGANLVQNGRFEELGTEQVSYPSDVTTITEPWSLDDASGLYIYENSGSGNGRLNFGTPIAAEVGQTYKLVINITISSGNANLKFASGNSQTVMLPNTDLVNGENIIYSTVTGVNGNVNRIFVSSGGTDNDFTLNSISVKQVDPNDRWILGTGWSYGDSIASCDGTQSSSSDLNTTSGFSVQNNAVKVTFDLIRTAGTLAATLEGTGQLDLTNLNSSGTYTFIATSSDATARLIFRADADFIGSITNVMLEQQKYVASNLKLNSGNYKSADPVIVSTKSVDLDGTDEYLEVTKKDFLGTSDFTISMWIKPDTVTEDNYFIGQSTDDDNRWYIRVRGSNSSIQFFSKNSGNQVISVLGGTPIANQWNHIVISADRDNNCKLYVNSVLSMTQAAATTASLTFTGNLRIGSFELFGVYFDGTMDDVGIFNAALTSDQVIELYNQGVPSNLLTHSANANLTGYWKMGDGTLDEAPLIADQTNATLGSDLVVNGNFATDSDWTFNSAYWNISGGTANALGVANGSFNQTLAVQSGKTYKIEIASTITSGNGIYAIKLGTTQQIFDNNTSNITAYLVASGDNVAVSIRPGASAFSVSSISVKQVNGNPAIMQNTPTIVTDAPLTKIRNYYRMGDGLLDKHQADNITLYSTRGLICDMIEPSLGTELLTDGDFPVGTSAWTLGTGWSLEAGACVRSGHGSNTDFRQSISISANKVYQVSYTRVYVSGTRTTNLFSDFETDGSNITLGDYRGTEETVTVVSFFMPTYTGTVPIRVFGINDWTGKITNVSVKEVNGVGGLMTNMINTDITNDVPS